MMPSSGLIPAYARMRPVPARLTQRWYRPLAVGLTVLALLWAGAVWVARAHAVTQADAWGLDYRVFLAYGERFLATGSLYLDWQLAGPYAWAHLPRPPAETPFDGSVIPCLYPPLVAYFVVPLVWLPAAVWWLAPLGLLAGIAVRSRPPAWSWPLLALVVGLPQVPAMVYVGGSTMWIAAFTAAGARWGWPAALIILKPTLGPVALLGARHRSWWVAVGVLALLSLPLAAEWARYMTAVGNAVGGSRLGLGDVPALAAAWWLSRSIRRGGRSSSAYDPSHHRRSEHCPRCARRQS